MGIPAEHIERFRQDLSEPPPKSVAAIEKLIEAGNWVSAEIAARLLVSDYPESAAAQACLDRVLTAAEGAMTHAPDRSSKRHSMPFKLIFATLLVATQLLVIVALLALYIGWLT